jgi:DNA-binding protein YbaB
VALPQEVLEAIAAAEGTDDAAESQPSQATAPVGHWLVTLFRRLADFFAKSAKEGRDDDLAYGYPPVADVQPPAYGVPVQVLMDLVRDAHKLLSQIKDALEGEEKKQVEALLDRIEQAFGTAAQKTDESSQSACDAVPQDFESVNDATFWTEFRLAVKATVPTQPVLAPLEAADQLQKAWQSVADLASAPTLNEGDVFSAFFALHTAVDAAVRTLRATAVNASEPTASNDESEMTSAGEQYQSETSSDAVTEQPVASAQDDEMTAQSVTPQQPTEPESVDPAERTDLQVLVGQVVAAALEPFVAELKALQETVQALQERVEKRRRVTQAVASSVPANGANDPKDIMARWMAATTDAERRRLLREAQKLLAAPIPIGEVE